MWPFPFHCSSFFLLPPSSCPPSCYPLLPPPPSLHSPRSGQGHAYGEHFLYCVQLTCLAVDSFIRRCNVLDIDDVSSQLQLTTAEWTMILGEPCPVLDRRSSSSTTTAAETTSALSKRQRTVGYRPFGGKLEFGQGAKMTLEEIVNESKAARKLKQRVEEELKKESESLLQQLQQMNVQSSLNGLDNVWIVKPAGKSRGRDIICANRINRILEYIGFGISGKEMHWVVQKYLERPFLINRRKFDIRQWVMVTDWNPLTVSSLLPSHFLISPPLPSPFPSLPFPPPLLSPLSLSSARSALLPSPPFLSSLIHRSGSTTSATFASACQTSP